MHVKEMWGMVGILAGDPSLSKTLRISEVLHYLNEGQFQIGKLLYDVEAYSFIASANINTTAGTAAYEIPLAAGAYGNSDFGEVVRVVYDSANSGTGYQANRVPIEDIGVISVNPFYGGRPSLVPPREPLFSIMGTQVTVYPTPTVTTTSGIVLTYRRLPPKLLFERVSEALVSTAAGAAGGTTIVDTVLTQRDDFWNECECIVENLANVNQRRIVSDFDAATDTLTVRNAYSAQVAITTTFSLYDHSIIPDQHHGIIVDYAAGLACYKTGQMDRADKLMDRAKAGLAAIAEKYKNPVKDQLYDGEPQSKTNPS